MHCCRCRSMLGWLPAPRPTFPGCEASCSDLQLVCLSLCPHGLLPASRVSPSALLNRKQGACAPGTLTESRDHTKRVLVPGIPWR